MKPTISVEMFKEAIQYFVDNLPHLRLGQALYNYFDMGKMADQSKVGKLHSLDWWPALKYFYDIFDVVR